MLDLAPDCGCSAGSAGSVHAAVCRDEFALQFGLDEAAIDGVSEHGSCLECLHFDLILCSAIFQGLADAES